MSRRKIAVGTTAVLLAGGGAAAWAVARPEPAPASAAPVSVGTAKVEKQDMVETREVDGTLDYGDAHPVMLNAQGAGQPQSQGSGQGSGQSPGQGPGAGTVTWLAPLGAIVQRGQPVVRVDNRPIPLLIGSLPLYRELAKGSEGPDVEQLERNLSALGYDDFTVDDTFTASTAEAVREWQDKLGITETGSVRPGDVVVAPGAIRVASHEVEPGAAASGSVLSWTGTTKQVRVDLKVTDQTLVKKGAKVTVELPTGKTLPATITAIGTVAQKPEAQPGAGPGSAPASGDSTIAVDIAIATSDAASAAGLDEAPVTVRLESARKPDVLTVPVMALLALSGGGYGVEVVKGGTSTIVAVELGMFAQGRVEVSGGGLAEGMDVGVPKK